MIELLLAAAVQVQTVRLPPVAPPQVPAPTPQVQVETVKPPVDASRVAIDLLPDLVVKDLRVEGDATVHVLVANEGTAAAGQFPVLVEAVVDGVEGKKFTELDGLGMGQARWVTFNGLQFPGKVTPESTVAAYPLGKATRVRALADPPSLSGTLFGSIAPPGTSPFGPKPKTCGLTGCVKERDENNNSLAAEGEAIARGAPDAT